MTDPRAVHAPEAYDLLCELEADLDVALPADVLAIARKRVAMTLGAVPWEAPDEDDAVVDFAEQFVIDCTGVDLAPLVPRLGEALVPFVKAMWVLDLGLRTDLVLGRLFPDQVTARAVRPAAAEPLTFDPFLCAVARLDQVDPLTTELVRLRVARHHNCRLCKSLRTRAAMAAGGAEALYEQVESFESSDLSAEQKVALRITESVIIRPESLDPATVAEAHERFTDAQLVEVVLDIMRNSANKVAVAFGADAPNVSEGLQVYDIAADGTMVFGEPLAVS
ncbi:MAG: hypothetical protein JO214_06150 [Frankiaceae bacterium]|nr:hypothetical protein [Frankiaceae bacterium]